MNSVGFARKNPKTLHLLPGTRVFFKAVKKKGDSKLSPRWERHFRVIEEIRPYVYRIKNPQTGDERSSSPEYEGHTGSQHSEVASPRSKKQISDLRVPPKKPAKKSMS